MSKSINVCYITDSNFVLPTATSLLSLIKVARCSLNIYIITNNIQNDNIIKYYKSFSAKDINIHVINKELNYQDLTTSHYNHVSKTALLKFEIPEILNTLDKVLYIDGDTLIFNDLKELYDTDISEYYIAAVSDFTGLIANHHKRLNHENYFNSGVMLLNLNRMRKDNITKQLIEYKKNKCQGLFMDQDTFNAVLSEKVLYLHPKFNLMLPNLKNCDAEPFALSYGITTEEALELLEGKSTILHITNYHKPWNSTKSDLFLTWYQYFKEINSKDLKDEFYNSFIENAMFSIMIMDSEINRLNYELQAIKNKLLQK